VYRRNRFGKLESIHKIFGRLYAPNRLHWSGAAEILFQRIAQCTHSRGATTARRPAHIPVAPKPMMQTAYSNTRLADNPSWICIERLPLNGEGRRETIPRLDFVENSQIPKPCFRGAVRRVPESLNSCKRENSSGCAHAVQMWSSLWMKAEKATDDFVAEE
jgi:hypothetical protein